ncbi:MAG: polymer-forming cytoskeletal protein [Pseudomonadota bacterium]
MKNDTEQTENNSEKKAISASNDQQSNSPIQNSQPKENTQMNTQAQPAQQDAQATTDKQDNNQQQSRVDIPNNFTRPNASQPTGQPSRPAYPGNYPGAQQSNYAGTAMSSDSDRKLMIGKGITLSGDISECDHLIVEGTIEATLKGANVLDISENGAFHGTAEIEEANIAGRFEGDITVSGRLTIQSTGTIIGSVSYKELAVEVGATIDGAISPIGSTNAQANPKGGKSKKASQDNSAELPFSGGKVAAE